MLGGGEVQQTIQTVAEAAPWDEALEFAKIVWNWLEKRPWGVPVVLAIAVFWIHSKHKKRQGWR